MTIRCTHNCKSSLRMTLSREPRRLAACANRSCAKPLHTPARLITQSSQPLRHPLLEAPGRNRSLPPQKPRLKFP